MALTEPDLRSGNCVEALELLVQHEQIGDRRTVSGERCLLQPGCRSMARRVIQGLEALNCCGEIFMFGVTRHCRRPPMPGLACRDGTSGPCAKIASHRRSPRYAL